jgi:hypothetical protein
VEEYKLYFKSVQEFQLMENLIYEKLEEKSVEAKT